MGPGSFQISPLDGSQPLLVFVNPKSGGRQGAKLYRKFLYHLNPRQVYNLGKGGPKVNKALIHEIPNNNLYSPADIFMLVKYLF